MDALKIMQKQLNLEGMLYIKRIQNNFVINAFYSTFNTITILGPLLFKAKVSSDLVKEPLLSHYAVDHELFHSLFTGTSSTLIDVYGSRSRCLMDHYGSMCSDFGKNMCNHAKNTIYEDGADAEGLRMLYEMFVKDHSGEMDNQIGVDDTTMQQAFFYFTSIFHCEHSENTHWIKDTHSRGSVRVNAVASLMPEFSKAFKCKAGDKMLTETAKCKIFGQDA
ncbi:hypothetical protein PMAYCL1PPCAC_33241 [Pristionchus mayeri]|uniref:Peptidase M13 C-terminal domain-containing protein n=1 Tax=Pristionchus mayeri TaxID=1317129 RepID=A0AAN5IGI6_9BILA|nr:hypothetical protein PMAYCL1PPCAC_33241 [Pristionchus mayeri]